MTTETPTHDYPPVRMPGYENALRLTQLLSGDEPLIGSEVDIEMERLVATRRYQLTQLPSGHSKVLPNRGRNVLNSLSQLPCLRVGSTFLQSRSLIESSTRIVEGVFQLVLFELCKRAIHKFSSSVDDGIGQSDSTGEETPVTGESSGESRCEHCGQPASRAQAALSAADTPTEKKVA